MAIAMLMTLAIMAYSIDVRPDVLRHHREMERFEISARCKRKVNLRICRVTNSSAAHAFGTIG